MRLQLPRNARDIAAARRRSLRPAEPVIVSYVGDVPWPNPTVYADSGERYDWSFATGLQVWIVVEPGTDASDAIRGLFRVAQLYPGIVDLEDETMGYVTNIEPLRVWAIKRDSATWRELFA